MRYARLAFGAAQRLHPPHAGVRRSLGGLEGARPA